MVRLFEIIVSALRTFERRQDERFSQRYMPHGTSRELLEAAGYRFLENARSTVNLSGGLLPRHIGHLGFSAPRTHRLRDDDIASGYHFRGYLQVCVTDAHVRRYGDQASEPEVSKTHRAVYVRGDRHHSW